jgi:hypothetical protein
MLSFEKKCIKKNNSTFSKNNRISVEAAKVLLNAIYHACLLLGSDVDALKSFSYSCMKSASGQSSSFDMVYNTFILQTHIHFQLLVFDTFISISERFPSKFKKMFDVYAKPIMSVVDG